jgi:adenylate cyclase
MPLAREQRKLAAIIAADVVGYSRLMGRDESGTLARLRKNRSERLDPVLAKYGGRLVKLTGDGALVDFASAVDALSAAIEFQQSMAEANCDQPPDTALVFRMGMHLGDLIVDGDDLYGDGVNVAARLEAEAPKGGIVVSSAVYEATAGRLKADFEDLGRLSLKNIEREVQAYSVHWEPTDWPISATVDAAAPSIAPQSAAEPLPLPDKPSIAVLPFQNMSGDPEQEYFADGMVEDIITALSRFKSLFVIARNSSFTYKGKAVDVRTVARELGVQYVLEGSIRKASGRVRVTAQLIDALVGSHIWAERYDRVLEDIFAVQEEVTSSIVGAIAPQIDNAEVAKTLVLRLGSVGAYELAVRAWAKSREAYNKTDGSLCDEAIRIAYESISVDARCGLAWSVIAFALWQHLVQGRTQDPETTQAEALVAANKAIEVDPLSNLAFTFRGQVQFSAGQIRAALHDLRHAVVLNPNDAISLFCLGYFESVSGDPETGIDLGLKALRLSPLDFWRPTMHQNLAVSYFIAGKYADGAREAQIAADEMPSLASAYATLAINFVGMGEIENAKAAVQSLRRINPSHLEARLKRWNMARSEDVRRATSYLRIAAGVEDPPRWRNNGDAKG